MVEFNTWADRNLVKKAAENLKGHPESKKYFVQADITKNEREELTRFKMKEEIMIDNPGSFVEINMENYWLTVFKLTKSNTHTKIFKCKVGISDFKHKLEYKRKNRTVTSKTCTQIYK